MKVLNFLIQHKRGVSKAVICMLTLSIILGGFITSGILVKADDGDEGTTITTLQWMEQHGYADYENADLKAAAEAAGKPVADYVQGEVDAWNNKAKEGVAASEQNAAEADDDLSGLNAVCYAFLRHILTMNFNNGMNDWLKFNKSDGDIINSVWKQGWIQVIGIGMLLIYFIIHINKEMLLNGREFQLTTLYGPLIKFGIAFCVIYALPYILSIFLNLNNSLIDEAGKAVNVSVYAAEAGQAAKSSDDVLAECLKNFKEAIKDMNFFYCVGFILQLVPVWLLTVLASLVMLYQGVSRKIEILVRCIFAPIGCGDIYNGEQSAALRYLKKLLALVFWGVMIVIILQIGNLLNANYITTIWSGAGVTGESLKKDMLNQAGMIAMLVLVPLAEIGMIASSKQIANDVLGV